MSVTAPHDVDSDSLERALPHVEATVRTQLEPLDAGEETTVTIDDLVRTAPGAFGAATLAAAMEHIAATAEHPIRIDRQQGPTVAWGVAIAADAGA